MQTNQWFKLAILAFVGIILSSVSLSLIAPGQPAVQDPAGHVQGASGHGGGTDSSIQQSNHGTGGTAGTQQTNQNQQLNYNQQLEAQYRLWEAQRFNNMNGYGMPYNYGYGNMPMNPNGMQYMPGPPYGYPGYPGGMYGPNPYMTPGTMNPNMNSQGSMNMPSGNSGGSNNNSNSGMGGSSGGGMSMM